MSEELNIDEQIAQVESNIKLQEYYINRSKALEELKADPKFQLAITEGYIQEELDRLFNALTAPRLMKDEEKKILMDQIDSIKYFAMYIGNEDHPGLAKILANNAEKIIADEEEIKNELLKKKAKEM